MNIDIYTQVDIIQFNMVVFASMIILLVTRLTTLLKG